MVSVAQKGAGVKALAFFAGLAAAKPVNNAQLFPRQDDAGNVTSSVPVASPSVTAAPSITGEIVAAQETQDATVSGTERKCSVQSVTALTTTSIATFSWTTYTAYSLTLDPTLGCTCDDGWMAGIATSYGDDGKGTVTVGTDPRSNVPARSIGADTLRTVPIWRRRKPRNRHADIRYGP